MQLKYVCTLVVLSAGGFCSVDMLNFFLFFLPQNS